MAQELTFKRTFDAPRELVFKAWTDPHLLAKWWGPTDFTTPICEVDPRPGGKLYIVMHGPKDSDFDIDLPTMGVFQEFDPPRRFVFSNTAMEDEKGVPQLETLCTVTFDEAGWKNRNDLAYRLLVKATPVAAACMGWGGDGLEPEPGQARRSADQSLSLASTRNFHALISR